ncbi:MAG: hypothetical protein J5798_14005 [Spirochaetaceae bacterium]|nr:hypothetical protein [Spirochaetaceae bacterium]
MTDKNALTVFYRQELETSIIEYLADKLKIDFRDAMKVYYNSKLSEQIEKGENGIDNLDYKNLAEDLIENEYNYFCKS